MPRVAIVTDSAACVPAALVQAYGIEVVPFQLVWNGEVFLDGHELPPDVFYKRFSTTQSYPTTATPTLGQFVAAYRRAAERADCVVAILLAHTLSSTILVAQQATAQVEAPVHVVESGIAANPQAFMVLAAARAAQQDASLEQVLTIVEACRERVGMFFALETLEHLRRGGRIGAAAGLLGSYLNIQPVLTLRDGRVQVVTVRRTRKAALDRLIQEVQKKAQGRPIRAAVCHGGALAEAQQLAERVQHTLDCVEFFITEFTPVMGAHTGPGIVGVAYCLEDER